MEKQKVANASVKVLGLGQPHAVELVARAVLTQADHTHPLGDKIPIKPKITFFGGARLFLFAGQNFRFF